MPLQLNSLNGSIILTPEDGSGVANLTVPRVGYQTANANIATINATQAEMEAGTESSVRSISPLRVAQAITALAAGASSTVLRSSSNLQSNKSYIIAANTSITVTLPSSPSNGDQIFLIDAESIQGNTRHTVSRNNNTIMGLSENLVLDIPGCNILLYYNGSSWRLI